MALESKLIDNDVGDKPKKLEVASQICSEYDPQTLLETSGWLLELANALPHDKGLSLNFLTIFIRSIDLFIYIMLYPNIVRVLKLTFLNILQMKMRSWKYQKILTIYLM